MSRADDSHARIVDEALDRLAAGDAAWGEQAAGLPGMGPELQLVAGMLASDAAALQQQEMPNRARVRAELLGQIAGEAIPGRRAPRGAAMRMFATRGRRVALVAMALLTTCMSGAVAAPNAPVAHQVRTVAHQLHLMPPPPPPAGHEQGVADGASVAHPVQLDLPPQLAALPATASAGAATQGGFTLPDPQGDPRSGQHPPRPHPGVPGGDDHQSPPPPGGQQPTRQNPPPNGQQPKPPTGQNPPPGGQQPKPPTGQNPPPKPHNGGQNPPPGGQNPPPNGGQNPPPGGQNPPPGGQNPPPGGQNPPPPGG